MFLRIDGFWATYSFHSSLSIFPSPFKSASAIVCRDITSRYEQANISSLLVMPFIFYVSFNFPAWMLKAAKVCYCIEHIELFKLCVCVCVFFFLDMCS